MRGLTQSLRQLYEFVAQRKGCQLAMTAEDNRCVALLVPSVCCHDMHLCCLSNQSSSVQQLLRQDFAALLYV
jgi:hypothetical protein